MPTSPEDRADVQKKLDDKARDISDATFRRHFSDYFTRKLWGDRPPPNAAVGQNSNKGQWGKDKWRKGGKFNRKTEGAVDMDARAETSKAAPADQLRERILLAALINHPNIFDEVEEHLGTVEFSAPELDKLRQQALNSLAADDGLDSEALRAHLLSEGFSTTLKALLSSSVYMHARFAREDTPIEEVLAGWIDTFERLTAKSVETELQKVEAALGEDTSAMAFERVKALKVT
jgi:DNA primase